MRLDTGLIRIKDGKLCPHPEKDATPPLSFSAKFFSIARKLAKKSFRLPIVKLFHRCVWKSFRSLFSFSFQCGLNVTQYGTTCLTCGTFFFFKNKRSLSYLLSMCWAFISSTAIYVRNRQPPNRCWDRTAAKYQNVLCLVSRFESTHKKCGIVGPKLWQKYALWEIESIISVAHQGRWKKNAGFEKKTKRGRFLTWQHCVFVKEF